VVSLHSTPTTRPPAAPPTAGHGAPLPGAASPRSQSHPVPPRRRPGVEPTPERGARGGRPAGRTPGPVACAQRTRTAPARKVHEEVVEGVWEREAAGRGRSGPPVSWTYPLLDSPPAISPSSGVWSAGGDLPVRALAGFTFCCR
jgi:hypothetical protein